MTAVPREVSSLGEGVYFSADDYAGFGRRLFILLVDLAVLVFAAVALETMWSRLARREEHYILGFLCSWLVFSYLYLAVLEPSRFRTLGFALAGVKIVNLRGERPSILRMTFRLMIWLLGPFNPLIDLIWLAGDDHKQTLRDKFAGTYVVKKDAVPAGHGSIRVATYYFLSFALWFPEVKKPRTQ